MTLLDDDRGLIGDPARGDQPGGERPGSGSRRGVLGDADCRIEEPRIRDGAGGIDRIRAVQVAALGAHLLQSRYQPRRVRHGPVNRLAVARRDQQMTGTGGDNLRVLRQQILLAQAQANSQPGAFAGHVTEDRR